MNKSTKTSSLIAIARIASHGDRGMPSGHLYAEMMGSHSLAEYQDVIGLLTTVKWATESNHLLRATETGRAIAAQVQKVIASLPAGTV